METCTICRGVADPGVRTIEGGPLCAECGQLLRWFMDQFDEKGLPIAPGTTFQELSIDSLDDVEWLIKAEEQFGVTIPDREAEKMKHVGDYLRYIRFHGAVPKGVIGSDDPLWDRALDG